jgi:hypothetical protein
MVMKTNQLTLYRGKGSVCFEISRYTLAQCGQNVQFLNIKPVDALKG